MILQDISFESPEENILYDETLLRLAEEGRGREVLRFWESPKLFVVLGRVSRPEDDINIENALRDRIPVLRRCSGGGTVMQGQGCLNYSLILSKETSPQLADLKGSYQFILGRVIHALKDLGVEALFHPISDIALVGTAKKISGNAQKRSRKFILHHGTILYNFDLDAMGRYLRMPRTVPEYRLNRTHREFVANIPAAAHSIKAALCKAFPTDSPESSPIKLFPIFR